MKSEEEIKNDLEYEEFENFLENYHKNFASPLSFKDSERKNLEEIAFRLDYTNFLLKRILEK